MNKPKDFKSVIEFLLVEQPDLTIRQIGVLINCAESLQTVRGLSTIMKTNKPSITRAIDKLESLSFVARKTDKDDKRSVNVSITQKGKKFFRQLWQTQKADEMETVK